MNQPHRFVQLPLDKNQWSPSPLPGQVVLVTSIDADGAVDVAPKSWVCMVAFAGPTVGFGCNRSHRTYRNVESTGDFVINIPDVSLARRVWRLPEVPADQRLALTGLTQRPARTVAAPVIPECPAHLECRHQQTLGFPGDEVFVLGTVTAVAVSESCLTGDPAAGYRALQPFFFLEPGRYAGLGDVQQV